MRYVPKRAELIEKIKGLISEGENRHTLSEWAFSIYSDDDLIIDDPIISKYLFILGGVDLIHSESEYLYTNDDFESWILELSHP